MAAYNTEDHDSESAVAPLVEFFELVHVGDTVQQMVQAYFEKEMAAYIDRTDFLNAVIREKKHFESALDDSVAKGLNAGVDILMNQAEHILMTQQDPRDYCPEDEVLDLAPTKACTMVIDCLRTHCNMLKGSTDKQIMEVFHQEVGIRLHTFVTCTSLDESQAHEASRSMLCKHFKRGIVSIPGGFQMIADLNTYHAFVASFKQPNLTVYFTALKMVGGLFIITSPKDLGQLARDVHRFDGTLSNEDLYEVRGGQARPGVPQELTPKRVVRTTSERLEEDRKAGRPRDLRTRKGRLHCSIVAHRRTFGSLLLVASTVVAAATVSTPHERVLQQRFGRRPLGGIQPQALGDEVRGALHLDRRENTFLMEQVSNIDVWRACRTAERSYRSPGSAHRPRLGQSFDEPLSSKCSDEYWQRSSRSRGKVEFVTLQMRCR